MATRGSPLRAIGLSTVSTGGSECAWLGGCWALWVCDPPPLDPSNSPHSTTTTTSTRDSCDGIPAHSEKAPTALPASCPHLSPPGVNRVKPVCTCKCLPRRERMQLPCGTDRRRGHKGAHTFPFLPSVIQNKTKKSVPRGSGLVFSSCCCSGCHVRV